MFDSNYNANDNNNNNNPFEDHLLNNFPSHLLDDEHFLDTIMPYQPTPPPPPQPPPPKPPEVNEDAGKKLAGKGMMMKKKQDGGGGSAKRKSGKKDRHSKIVTARGPRDRRMRLSLQIARKFFDLQDMLGFDKASKTIEWLFNKSRAAIKDLSENTCTTAATAAADNTFMMSSSSEQNNGGWSDVGSNKEKLMFCGRMNSSSNGKNSSSKAGIVCKRKEARARARERTKVKLLKSKKSLEIMEENPNNINNDTLDDDEDDNKNIIINNNNGEIRVDKVNQLEDQMASVGIIDNFLASSSSSMASFMEFPGNRFAENGRLNAELMQELVVEYSGYITTQQGPNSAFMDKTYNQGF